MRLRGSGYGGIGLQTNENSGEIFEVEKLKKELEESKKLNDEVQKVAGLGSYVFNVGNGLWTSSSMMDKIFGIDKNYKRSVRGWARIVHPVYRKEMVDYFSNEVLGKKNQFNKEYKIIRVNDGEERWVHGLGGLILNKKGGVDEMIGTIQDITDRKNIELALRKSEMKYRNLFASMLDGFAIVSMDGRLIEFNEVFRNMVGYKEKELRKMTFRDLTPKKWYRFENSIINDQILKKGSSEVYEKEYRHKNGMIFPVELRSYLIKDEKGKPEAMWAVVRDITASKKAENALIKEKEKLNSILINTKHGIALTDSNNKFVLVNPYMCELLGYSFDELTKMSFKDVTYPEDLPESIRQVKLLKEGKIDSFSIEKRYIKKDKHIIWAKLNISVIRDELGKIINNVISLEDITDLKNIEESLRNSEEQLSAVLMNMSDAVCVVDEENKIVLVNKSVEKITGYKKENLIGKKFNQKMVLLSEKKDKLMFPDETFDFTKEIELERGDGLLITANNQRIPVEGKYSPILNKNGRFIGGVVVGRDATEYRNIDKMRTDFISLVSHQLRTPLTGIKWFVEIITERLDKMSKDDLANYVKRIKESNERLIGLVNDLLQVSRIESGRIKTDIKCDINLKKIIERSLDDQVSLMNERGVKIIGVDKIPLNIKLFGDETQMVQVFGNIINNAIKYSPVCSTVNVKIGKRSKKEVVIVIADHGIGIPKEQQKKLFEKFFRGNNVDKETSGSGLGLYVVKSMLKNNGGNIWIKSIEGKGTKVFIELPLGVKEKVKEI